MEERKTEGAVSWEIPRDIRSYNYDVLYKNLSQLSSKDSGFFVEVGAGDGITDNATLLLENSGWHGILIEPNIDRCARCQINRPKAAVLNYECVAPAYSGEEVEASQVPTENHKGNCRTLTAILEEFEVKKLDLLVVNMNGNTLNVFKGLSFLNHRPNYILIDDGANPQIISSLVDHHYKILKNYTDNCGTQKALYQTTEQQISDSSDDVIVDNTKGEMIEKAWDIAAKSNASYPGKYIAYYSLDVDGKHFSGERQWEERWEYIGKALRDACDGELKGKNILELGCNLGLLSVWAAKEGAICHGYEYEADILQGCKQVASAFGVADRCTWSQADFNTKEVTDRISNEFDICTCLSVMNWVKNKNNLIDLLSKQKVVLYEGHDNDQIETSRLRHAGFSGIERVAVSERGRGVFIARKDKIEKKIDWDEFEKRYGLEGAAYKIPQVNTGDGTLLERIYFKTEVWKARLSNKKNPAKLASPHEEAEFLKILKDVPNVCRLKEYIEKKDHTITVMDYFPNIGTLEQTDIPPEFRRKVEKQKNQIIKSVNNSGILHNDMFDRNFLVNSNYDVCLIDFDQAQFAEGRNDFDDGYYYKPSKLKSIAGKKVANNSRLNLVTEAWDIAARSNASYPGKYIAYYSLDVDGRHFSGERPWKARWEYIGKALRDACGGELEGKRLLELGCNLGLLSVWAAKEGAICHGYEYEADILQGCKQVASAFGVADRCTWSQADFNTKEVTDRISNEFDICTCLSVMNWVRNKNNLMDLLSRQRVVLYEGHDSEQVEIERLREAGFADIQKITSSERKRSVFVAKK